jgi:hypothetical protein
VEPGKRASDLTAAWPSAYDLTPRWAQALTDRLPNLDGIIYESHQVVGHSVVLYQHDKSAADLFTVSGDPEPFVRGPRDSTS